jgi:hypothetical protein
MLNAITFISKSTEQAYCLGIITCIILFPGYKVYIIHTLLKNKKIPVTITGITIKKKMD